MTSHAAAYETISSRGHVGPGAALQNLESLTIIGLGWLALNDTTNAIQRALIPFSGFDPAKPPVHKATYRTRTTDASVISIGTAYSQQTVTSLSGTPLESDTNIIISVSGFASGRLAPDIVLDFNGDAGTALAALTGTTNDVDVCCEVGYIAETYQGIQHFCEFQENPPNTDSSGSERLAELLDLFEVSSAQFQIGVDATGQPVLVEQCGFAALDPSGVIYIRPEDIGPGALQIPAAFVDNSAAAFRAHPSVFYPSGKSQYVRAISRQAIDQGAVNADTVQPIKIISVTTSIPDSTWLVTIDGAPMIVRISHPAGSDFRRPRDIWENVILPLVNQGGALQGDVIYAQVQNGVGDARMSRLAYADYWRCLPLPGTRITQDGGG